MKGTIIILILILFYSITAFAQKIHLVENGKSSYTIVVPAKEKEEINQSALLLQQYLQKITGALLPIITDESPVTDYEILLGATNRLTSLKNTLTLPALKNDGFWIKTTGDKLLIYGDSPQGIVFGVTSFLEDYLGCRRYTPEVEKVPKKTDIILDTIDDMQVPQADIRIIHGVSDPDFMNWRKLGTAKGWGGPFFVHTFQYLVAVDEYFQQHPEYFSMVNGQRIPDGQLCLTNPDVVKLSVQALRNRIKASPGIIYWSISQNDNQRACQCNNCKAIDSIEGSPSGTLLRFVNQLADSFPDRIITTLAYQYTRKPPKITKPLKNVMVTLCSIELNRSKPILKDKTSKSFRQDMQGWSKICNNLMIWDYEVQFTNYLCPFPLFHTLQSNQLFFGKNNAHAFFLQADVYKGVEAAELKAYLLSKLLWNPEIKVKDVIDDFFSGYYEEAAPFIGEYFTLLHKNATKHNSRLNIFGSPVWYANTFLSKECLKDYNILFDQAEAAVSEKPEILQRVKMARLPIMYAALEIAKTDPLGERGWFTLSADGSYAPKPEMTRMLNDVVEICRHNNIQNLREGGLTPERYAEKLLKMMDIQSEGNLAFRKPVTIEPLPEQRYSFPGPERLTNGAAGNDDFRLGYLGWKGVDPTITIDLQHDTLVHEIKLSSYQFSVVGILHPLTVTIYTSGDGKDYKEVGTLASEQNKDKQITKMQFSIADLALRARYIRMKVEGNKTLPPWHPDSGKPAWIFLDQVVVR